MDKFKTTLGDAIAAKTGSPNHEVDWRADMRANDIARRPPPSSYQPPPSTPRPERPVSQGGPDRGYIEQPAERIPTTVMPLVMLRRTPVPPPAPRDATPVVASPTVASPEPLPEDTEMPRAKKKNMSTADQRARAVAAVLADGQPGAQARVAKKFGVHESNVSQWMKQYRKANPAPASLRQQTLSSAPSSGPVSVSADTLPQMPTISIPGLPEYIAALVRHEVKAELRRRLSGD